MKGKTGLNFFHTIVILANLLIAFPVVAQLSTYNLTHYTEQDGLPGTQVNKIITDRFGYVWVGTINGLSRFDGYGFKRFYDDPNNPSSMKGLVIWSLFEDSKGRIWVGSGPSYLNRYDPVTQSFRQYEFKHLVEYEGSTEVNISTIGERDGRVYFTVHTYYWQPVSSTLLYLDETEDKLKRVEIPDHPVVKNILSTATDKQDNIWYFGYDGLMKLDRNENLVKINIYSNKTLKDEFVTEMKCDEEGHLWMITNFSRIIDFNPINTEYQIYSPAGIGEDNAFNSLCIGPQNSLWMGTTKGIFLLDKEKKKVIGFNADASKKIESAGINSITYDSFGSMWIGTMTYGLFRYEEKSVFKSYSYDKDDPNSLTNGWVNNIYETHDGKILITTSGPTATAGINLLDPQDYTIRPFPYKSIFKDCSIVSGMMENAPGEYFMHTNMGLCSFSLKNRIMRKAELTGWIDSLVINSFLNDSKGNMWVGTMEGLYKRNAGSQAFKKYDLRGMEGSDAASNMIVQIRESNKHGLWLITNNGLFQYNYATDEIKRKGFDKTAGDIFVTQDINSFYEDSTGIAWVGAWQGGLSRFNVETGEIKTYTMNDGLPSMSIQSIVADEQTHTLWMSTFEGLSRFVIPTEQFYNYSVSDGIQSQLFADGSFLKTSGGLILFGGSNGLTVFDPKDINKTSLPPKVFLTDLKLFNKSVLPGEGSILKTPIYESSEIKLNYDQNNISLEFIALHYSNPAKNRYSYKLENYDDDWREVVNYHEAFYANLPPGNYEFQVKAANNNGVWNNEGARLKIIVAPPWWKTLWAYSLYSMMFVGGVFGADRFFRHRLIQKEREKTRTRELEQAKEIEKAYTELKSTQAQLIQSEKMASLGELTAGIAHEIQNPLNFVNNFSEVNTELLGELEQEADKGNLSEVKTIAKNIQENEQKIVHHGKRADAIVKSMLQHSRKSSGQKELTDINALCDEYLRLAFHGLRAKDKSFNAKFEANLDPALPKIDVLPQDFGRVILNLINNAFYAVSERKAMISEGFEPFVKISTHRAGNKVEIRIRDNGTGIPLAVVDKIFQPFFTTKPTGQGTGLGLSLSYDIVTKGHGGDLKVESKENEGTTFIIILPIK